MASMIRHAAYLWIGLVGCWSLIGCSSQKAFTYPSALEQARRTNRLVIVEFWSLTSSDCIRMDQHVYSDPGVRQHLEDFVRVRLDYFLNRKLAESLAIGAVPGLASVRPDGSLIAAQTGYLDKDALHRFLIRSKVFR